MDEIVLRAMQKWPDVPQVFGWLRLDRRGHWLVKGARETFERIGNAAVVEFIHRNYEVDERGRWFFQNGPQRVFVALDYTPWVYRLDEACQALVTHTGRPAGRVDEVLLDETGAMLVVAEAGVGVVDDRDMARLVDLIAGDGDFADMVEAMQESGEGPAEVSLLGHSARLRGIASSGVPARFGFDPRPAPPAGAPDC